jgi:hypothetical protein
MERVKQAAAVPKVIVVRQPWAWLIVNGYKDVENRSWATRHRGPLLIQASASLPSKADMEEYRRMCKRRRITLPEEFDTGGIVGMAHLDDCVTHSRSKWYIEGQLAWVLSKPKRLPFVPMKGRLGIFDPPKKVMQRLEIKA